MTKKHSVVYLYHSFFFRSSVDGYLGCFHVLPIVNSATVNIGIHVSFQLWFPQGICPVVGLLGHMVVLLLLFKGTSILFSMVAVSIYIPTNSTRGSPFLHILSKHLLFVDFFGDGHSDWYEAIPHYSFDLHFSNNE